MVQQQKTVPDYGHANLLEDLGSLLNEAVDYQFHDFRNTAYDTPKVILASKLTEIIDNIKNGKYDNSPTC